MTIARRHLLKSLIAATIASQFPVSALAATSAKKQGKRYPWKNWSGNLECFPEQRLAPQTLAELQTMIRDAHGRVRMVGAGHSFTPLPVTDETMISARRLSGLQRANAAEQTATFKGGTILSEMGPKLVEQNQALINMPDIDQQTIAGAIATGTHGTGRELGSLSSYVTEMELVTASGDLVRCSRSEHPDLFAAAGVNLGALGVVHSLTMQNRSPFKLRRESRWLPFEEMRNQAESFSRQNRNFEFYYFPFTGMTLGDFLNETDEAITDQEEIDGNSGVMDLKTARDYLSWSDKLRELILSAYMKTIEPSRNVDHSYAIYASDRNVRFNEMEYHLPVETGLDALQEVISLIEKNHKEVFFPIECRFVKNDDIWLSPFYQRDCISIAVHRYFEEDYLPLFKTIEPILQKHGGRPHWGKINTFTREQFRQAYPRWADFEAVRQQYDPQGKFLNAYLAEVFDQ